MLATPATQRALALFVPRATGTHGDALIAWGLAIFVSELLNDEEVFLSDAGDHFRLEIPASRAALDRAVDAFTPARLRRSRLKWLACAANNRIPPSDLGDGFTLDRDQLRDAYQLWRKTLREMKSQANGGEPAITAPADTQLYPFYEVLTNPGTQWAGYNSFVERLYGLLTPAGVHILLAQYLIPEEPAADSTSGPQPRAPSKRSAKPPTFNPPGFLYPGMNKGPTMRVTGARGVTIGSGSAPDWTLVDRGDRTIFENYLAYIGYFQVARIVTTKAHRVVIAPIPDRVAVPYILNAISSVARRDGLSRELEDSDLTEYLAAQNALEYGAAALTYLTELQHGEEATRDLRTSGVAFEGVYLSVYWRPNGNVFAPRRMTQVALPIWLPALQRQSYDLAKTTIEQHQARLKRLRGRPWDENKLSAEQRQALSDYLLALNGDLLAWFHAVAAWFPAARAAARANWKIGLWNTEEVRRIALAMNAQHEQASLAQLLDAPEFKRLASTIRLSTVVPHIARQRRKTDPSAQASPWDIRYELVTQLRTAADRGPQDFLREFYAFIAQYNDETARPKTGQGRPFARTNDLQWLSERMNDPFLRKVLPAALLAFGTSLHGKPTGTGAADSEADSDSMDISSDDESQ